MLFLYITGEIWFCSACRFQKVFDPEYKKGPEITSGAINRYFPAIIRHPGSTVPVRR